MSQLQTLLFRIGGVLMIIGAALPLFVPAIAPYVYTLGAMLFCPIQMLDRYEGSNPVTRRLRRQQLFGSFALLVAGALMFFSLYHIPPFRGREWQIALIIGAIFEIVPAFRIKEDE